MATFQTLNAQSVLWAISEQRLGFEFGPPERVDDKALSVVLPILRKSSVARSYVTYPEVDNVLVKDSGAIDRMIAENQGKETCFIRSGTIFKGGTQERTSLRSTIVLAGEKADIKVRCVHQSKGIRLGTGVTYGTLNTLNFDRQVYTKSFTPTDQSNYWMVAQQVTNSLRARGLVKSAMPARSMRPMARGTGGGRSFSASNHPTYVDPVDPTSFTGYVEQAEPMMGGIGGEHVASDDLFANLQDMGKNLDQVLRKIKLHEDQAGLALITDKGVETVEVFDVHQSWKAMHEDAVKRLGPDLAKQDNSGVFDYKPEKAQEVVKAVLAYQFEEKLIFEHKPKNGDPHYRIMSLTADRYTGEVTELNGQCIHLMLLRMEN